MVTTPQSPSSDSGRAMWRRCLPSALRTAAACAIVYTVTLYFPKPIRQHITFPAFSYVTVILIITDATLGDTLQACWLAAYATIQGVCPAMLSLWLIGPDRLTVGTTVAAAAISAFVVALPENTHLIAKRIALGQIVIVYVAGFCNGSDVQPVMHPVHVAASTAVGVVACVLALLFPFPRLATHEVGENRRLYCENANERMKLYLNAFCAEDNALAQSLISQAKSLSDTRNKLLQFIESKQEITRWEKILLLFYKQNQGENVQEVEMIMRGLEKCWDFPISSACSELKNDLNMIQEKILKRVTDKIINIQQEVQEKDEEVLQTIQISATSSISSENLASLFFIFCLKLLDSSHISSDQGSNKFVLINRKRVAPALRCSLSLGFAVLFGLIYSRQDGFWAGLPVAITYSSAREATFTAANIKFQGTVLGTVYGVIACFIFKRYEKIRFISLLPWLIFCSFLRESRMYARAGGVSAAIGAVLILGRWNFGAPSEFAIARIVETFIGLSCSIVLDIIFQPTRAAALVKVEASTCFHALRESIGSINLDLIHGFTMEESLKKLKDHVTELGKLIEEAEVEPCFWLSPFQSDCHVKLKGSLSKMGDFLHFVRHALRLIEQECKKNDSSMWKEVTVKLASDLKVLKDTLCSQIESLEELDREYEKKNTSVDLEMGKLGKTCMIQRSGLSEEDEIVRESINSFLQHLNDIGRDKNKNKQQMILSLSTVIFCMNGLMRETKEIVKAINEHLQ